MSLVMPNAVIMSSCHAAGNHICEYVSACACPGATQRECVECRLETRLSQTQSTFPSPSVRSGWRNRERKLFMRCLPATVRHVDRHRPSSTAFGNSTCMGISRFYPFYALYDLNVRDRWAWALGRGPGLRCRPVWDRRSEPTAAVKRVGRLRCVVSASRCRPKCSMRNRAHNPRISDCTLFSRFPLPHLAEISNSLSSPPILCPSPTIKR